MSHVLTNVKVYLAQYDISGFLNSVKLDYAAKALNDSRMGHTTEVNTGGVKTVNFAIAGFGDPAAAGMEAIAYDRIGTANLPLTASPLGAAPGDVAYFFNALNVSMKAPFGNHGELAPYAGTATTSGGPLVRGQVFLSADAAKTGTGVSSAIQLGPVTAAQRVYVALHVLAVSGTSPTLDLVIQSDALGAFGSPETRLSLAQATAPTSVVQALAGPFADEWWRAYYVIGGTGSPSFTFVVTVGIL